MQIRFHIYKSYRLEEDLSIKTCKTLIWKCLLNPQAIYLLNPITALENASIMRFVESYSTRIKWNSLKTASNVTAESCRTAHIIDWLTSHKHHQTHPVWIRSTFIVRRKLRLPDIYSTLMWSRRYGDPVHNRPDPDGHSNIRTLQNVSISGDAYLTPFKWIIFRADGTLDFNIRKCFPKQKHLLLEMMWRLTIWCAVCKTLQPKSHFTICFCMNIPEIAGMH